MSAVHLGRRSSRTSSHVRAALIAVVVPGVLCLGCTGAPGTAPTASPSSDGPTRSGAATPGSTSPQPGPAEAQPPQSAVQRWREDPALAPAGLDAKDVVLDVTTTGPQDVALPDVSGYETLEIYVVCDRAVPYDVGGSASSGSYRTWTGGTACSQIADVSYTTPPLDVDDPPVRVSVDVPASVRTAVTVYGQHSSDPSPSDP